jgi:two-component system C4-dicarboxylate transport response regulator DctD
MSINALPVFFIDDEKIVRQANKQSLQLGGFNVSDFAQAEAVLPLLSREWPGVVISDIRMPGLDGLTFLAQVQAIDRNLPVILITGHGDVAMAVKAMRDGAYDFIEKPFAPERLLDTVKRALESRTLTLENRQLKAELAIHNAPGPRLIGNTAAMQRLRATIAQVADTDTDVLVVGETGTGKELVARALHEHSRRAAHHFVAVNCGAVPEHLLESELFGHEPGAFTDAKSRRIGRFEYANQGTLLLDEIESMPLPSQVHLLRVLQERSVERLGTNTPVPLDLRVVAAVKIDLAEASQRGEFREDLYYRLNVVTLEIPPLRERLEDIPLLFQHFALVASARYDRPAPPLEASHIRALLAHRWPGNVRELRNIAERYVLLGENLDYDLERLIHGGASEVALTLPEQLGCFEKYLIGQQLSLQKGNLKKTMDVLGIPRKTLYDKMRKYDLDKAEYKIVAET